MIVLVVLAFSPSGTEWRRENNGITSQVPFILLPRVGWWGKAVVFWSTTGNRRK